MQESLDFERQNVWSRLWFNSTHSNEQDCREPRDGDTQSAIGKELGNRYCRSSECTSWYIELPSEFRHSSLGVYRDRHPHLKCGARVWRYSHRTSAVEQERLADRVTDSEYLRVRRARRQRKSLCRRVRQRDKIYENLARSR